MVEKKSESLPEEQQGVETTPARVEEKDGQEALESVEKTTDGDAVDGKP